MIQREGHRLVLPVQSSDELAMTLSWNGHHLMLSTSALCPPTTGVSLSILPVYKTDQLRVQTSQGYINMPVVTSTLPGVGGSLG